MRQRLRAAGGLVASLFAAGPAAAVAWLSVAIGVRLADSMGSSLRSARRTSIMEMMADVSTHYVYLAPNPKSAYRQLFVKGTRIRARVLYGWYACQEPMSPEQIATEYNLPVEAVKEAIAYCESNPQDLLDDYAREEALMEAAGMNDPAYKYHPSPKLLSPQERSKLRRS